jgi:hypothetical protein
MLSPLLELSECSFQHVLPNFKECVWDCWGLDVFTFNAFGVWAGYRLLHWGGGGSRRSGQARAAQLTAHHGD